jgi:hypothetical protein
MTRVLFCGDRDWNDGDAIRKAFDRFRPSVVIEGEARGADKLSRREAELRGMSVKDGTILPFPADWGRYREAAGPIRNQQMLDEGNPDLVVAFHSDLANSKGTADMVKRAREAGCRWR